MSPALHAPQHSSRIGAGVGAFIHEHFAVNNRGVNSFALGQARRAFRRSLLFAGGASLSCRESKAKQSAPGRGAAGRV